MSLQQQLYSIFLSFINENYDIKSFDHLKEVFVLESEKIFNFIYSKLKDEITQKNSNINAQEKKDPYDQILIVCEDTSNNSFNNFNEVIKTTNSANEIVICERRKCSKSFGSQEAYKEHLQFHEKEEKRKAKAKIRCTEGDCKTTFSSKNAFKNHIKKIHENERLNCQYCQKQYKYSSSLKYHINKFHLKINPYMCIYSRCEKMFPSRNNWFNHIKHCRFSRKINDETNEI